MSYKGTSLVYKLSFDGHFCHKFILNTTHHFKHCQNYGHSSNSKHGFRSQRLFWTTSKESNVRPKIQIQAWILLSLQKGCSELALNYAFLVKPKIQLQACVTSLTNEAGVPRLQCNLFFRTDLQRMTTFLLRLFYSEAKGPLPWSSRMLCAFRFPKDVLNWFKIQECYERPKI